MCHLIKPTLKVGKYELHLLEQLVQGHTANTWQNEDQNLGLPILGPQRQSCTTSRVHTACARFSVHFSLAPCEGLGQGSPGVVPADTFVHLTEEQLGLFGEAVSWGHSACWQVYGAGTNTVIHFWVVPCEPQKPTIPYLGPEPGMGPRCDPNLPHRPPTWLAWGWANWDRSPSFLVQLCPWVGMALALWFIAQLPRTEAN